MLRPSLASFAGYLGSACEHVTGFPAVRLTTLDWPTLLVYVINAKQIQALIKRGEAGGEVIKGPPLS